MPKYPFTSDDPLAKKIIYNYFPYGGTKFLEDFRQYRLSFLNVEKSSPLLFSDLVDKLCFALQSSSSNIAYTLMRDVRDGINSSHPQHSIATVRSLIKNFEVNKRLYDSYSLKPKLSRSGCVSIDLNLYLYFGILLVETYKSTQILPALNSLSKLLDILCSLYCKFNERQSLIFSTLIDLELDFLDSLHASTFTELREDVSSPFMPQSPGNKPHHFTDISLLLADTKRSLVYAQALQNYSYSFRSVILVSPSGENTSSVTDQPLSPHALSSFTPDFSILGQYCRSISRY